LVWGKPSGFNKQEYLQVVEMQMQLVGIALIWKQDFQTFFCAGSFEQAT
jgi:hypothetical protein